MPKSQTSWSSQRPSEPSRLCPRLRLQGHSPNALSSGQIRSSASPKRGGMTHVVHPRGSLMSARLRQRCAKA
jgi:hypothetical protein